MHWFIYKCTGSSSSKSDRFFWFYILFEHQHIIVLNFLNCIRSNILVDTPKLIWSESDIITTFRLSVLFNILNLPNNLYAHTHISSVYYLIWYNIFFCFQSNWTNLRRCCQCILSSAWQSVTIAAMLTSHYLKPRIEREK